MKDTSSILPQFLQGRGRYFEILPDFFFENLKQNEAMRLKSENRSVSAYYWPI